MKLTAEGIGGLATAAALFVSIVTFWYTYKAQDSFNRKQLEMMAASNEAAIKGLTLQSEAARAQREASAVEALGRYLESAPAENKAWASSEAIIDMVGDDPAWQATARRALKHNPGNLKTIECELYSEKFVKFAAATFNVSVTELCAHRASPNSANIRAK